MDRLAFARVARHLVRETGNREKEVRVETRVGAPVDIRSCRVKQPAAQIRHRNSGWADGADNFGDFATQIVSESFFLQQRWEGSGPLPVVGETKQLSWRLMV